MMLTKIKINLKKYTIMKIRLYNFFEIGLITNN